MKRKNNSKDRSSDPIQPVRKHFQLMSKFA